MSSCPWRASNANPSLISNAAGHTAHPTVSVALSAMPRRLLINGKYATGSVVISSPHGRREYPTETDVSVVGRKLFCLLEGELVYVFQPPQFETIVGVDAALPFRVAQSSLTGFPSDARGEKETVECCAYEAGVDFAIGTLPMLEVSREGGCTVTCGDGKRTIIIPGSLLCIITVAVFAAAATFSRILKATMGFMRLCSRHCE